MFKMITLELFCGTKSFSKVAQELGHNTFTVDNSAYFNPDFCEDILRLDVNDFGKYDVLWASPPCTAFSVASIGKNWYKGNIPKSANAFKGLDLLDKTVSIIAYNKPRFWFIENPRGIMRNVIEDMFKKYGIKLYKRVTITYCQYGDTRMKPTDIWTNLPFWEGKCCKNNDNCHVSAPRGSRTGTQGLKNATARGVIPPALFKEIFEHIDKNFA